MPSPLRLTRTNSRGCFKISFICILTNVLNCTLTNSLRARYTLHFYNEHLHYLLEIKQQFISSSSRANHIFGTFFIDTFFIATCKPHQNPILKTQLKHVHMCAHLTGERDTSKIYVRNKTIHINSTKRKI